MLVFAQAESAKTAAARSSLDSNPSPPAVDHVVVSLQSFHLQLKSAIDSLKSQLESQKQTLLQKHNQLLADTEVIMRIAFVAFRCSS